MTVGTDPGYGRRNDRGRARWGRFVALVGLFAVLAIAGLLWAGGGIRITSPHGAMKARAGEFAMPEGGRTVGTYSEGERVCGWECVPWRFSRYVSVPDYTSLEEECAALRSLTEDWLGQPVRVVEEKFEGAESWEPPCIYAAPSGISDVTAIVGVVSTRPQPHVPVGARWEIELLKRE